MTIFAKLPRYYGPNYRRFAGLTPRQQFIYDMILRFVGLYGKQPTIREIGAHCGIRSPNGVMGHLKALEAKGRIALGDMRHGSLTLCGLKFIPVKEENYERALELVKTLETT